jgi:hypothetical protein
VTARLGRFLAECRKLLAAVVGLAGEAVATGVLHGRAEQVCQAVIAVGTVLGVYAVPNAPPDPGFESAQAVVDDIVAHVNTTT